MLHENEESIVVFSHTVIKIRNNTKVPITDKHVVISSDKTLRYFVCGNGVAAKKHELSEILDNVKLLPQFLESFQKMTVCKGLGVINIHLLPIDSIMQDCVDQWRHKDCTMISKERCDRCMKMRQLVLQKERRLKRNKMLIRISQVSNPMDHRKLFALRKKNLRERREKRRARQRTQLLKQSLRRKANEIQWTTQKHGSRIPRWRTGSLHLL